MRCVVFGLVLLAAVSPAGRAAAAEGPATVVRGTITRDTRWTGAVEVEGTVSVGHGALLTVAPGTIVRFRPGASLSVVGALLAEGTPDRPVRFSPADPGGGPWGQIILAGTAPPSLLSRCEVTGAAGILITAGEHRIADCDISSAPQGISVTGQSTRATIENNRISDIEGNGVECLLGSRPRLAGNRIERCGAAGVAASQDAVPEIVGNTVSACGTGISLQRTEPAIRGNLLLGNGRGLALNLVGGGRPIQDNIVRSNEVGILCENFSAPVISGNIVEGNGDGIVCFQAASPLITANRIVGNRSGVSAVQISNPEVTGNLFENNAKGIYLHLSSYAAIHGNDFEGNQVALELGNMSADWERHAGATPSRGRRQQLLLRRPDARRGPAPASDDGAHVLDAVDATGNWWGEETTREMSAKGPDADIAAIVDYHDVPTRVYEGDPVEYVQDRVRYAPWAHSPFRNPSVPPAGAPLVAPPP